MSDLQEIINFARNFNKFKKLNQKSGNGGQNFGNLGKKNFENKPQSSENCFECQGRGHKAFECPNMIRTLEKELGKKCLHATLSDDEKNSDT